MFNEISNDWNRSVAAGYYHIIKKYANISRNMSFSTFLMVWSGCTVATVAQKYSNMEIDKKNTPDPRLTIDLVWVSYVPYNVHTSRTIFIIHWILQCKWAKFNLKYLVGVWPDKKNSGVLQIYRGPINGLLIIFIVLIPRFMALSFYWDNIDVVIYSTTTNITFIMAVLKITVLYLKKEVFVKFLDSMVSDWNNSMTKNEKNLMIESAIKSHNISITSTILTYLSCLLATIVQTWYNLESKQIIDPDPRLTTNLIWVVFLLYDTSSRINFIVTWLLQLYASAIGAVVYVSFDTLIIIIVLHICAQLKIIQLRIKKLYDNEYSKNIDITMKLIENVKKHIQLNRFAKKCENCCNIVLLLQLITWYFTFCFQGYALVEASHLN
ncbi:hypothetical protein HCN44_001761 [Aphidius gifuensis]|uniref:Odorant receptor n=1 Tax=Aphidius gifuensis TaxID=684658 RepID=A0A834XUI2_APHGI|nr:hypothetical protein HCN44_001761 [Aphidius gifuensis]